MTAKEIFNYILVESGQHIVYDEINTLELNLSRFSFLLKRTLADYDNFKPYTRKFNVPVEQMQGRGGYVYEFVEVIDGDIPEWISEVVPVLRSQGDAYLHDLFYRQKRGMDLHNSIAPIVFIWRYEKPILYVPISRLVDITAHYKRKIKDILDINNVLIDYEVTGIDYDDEYFWRLISARFLKSIAGSRRAFTNEEIIIKTDADSLLSESREDEKTALQEMKEASDFYFAWS